jgi:hypothetical protein
MSNNNVVDHDSNGQQSQMVKLQDVVRGTDPLNIVIRKHNRTTRS